MRAARHHLRVLLGQAAVKAAKKAAGVSAKGVTLHGPMDITPGFAASGSPPATCQAILRGVGAEAPMCGAASMPGRPWCEEHARLFVVTPEPASRVVSAAKLADRYG